MGLLDDAIREHLDLKRKHGAGDDELRRQETEALGPARRDFTGDASQAAEPAVGDSEEAAPAATEEPVAEPAGWLDDEAPFDAAAEVPPPSVEAPPEPVAEAPLPAPDPAPAAEEVPAPERRESHTPTQGFDALSRDDEAPEDGAEDGDEDVLEETPDFLQDTPEHDRLWFEQKPPRDFDFDG
jgi:outer membrane biosynthesis protein TonB